MIVALILVLVRQRNPCWSPVSSAAFSPSASVRNSSMPSTVSASLRFARCSSIIRSINLSSAHRAFFNRLSIPLRSIHFNHGMKSPRWNVPKSLENSSTMDANSSWSLMLICVPKAARNIIAFVRFAANSWRLIGEPIFVATVLTVESMLSSTVAED